MKIVCAWCGKEMGEKDGGGEEGVTHSLCEECLTKMKAEKEKEPTAEGESEQ